MNILTGMKTESGKGLTCLENGEYLGKEEQEFGGDAMGQLWKTNCGIWQQNSGKVKKLC